jgi:hypothetical protein
MSAPSIRAIISSRHERGRDPVRPQSLWRLGPRDPRFLHQRLAAAALGDFTDPLDAIGARFQRSTPQQRADGRDLTAGDRRALKVLGLA